MAQNAIVKSRRHVMFNCVFDYLLDEFLLMKLIPKVSHVFDEESPANSAVDIA